MMVIVSKIKASKLVNRPKGLHPNKVIRDVFVPANEKQAAAYVKLRESWGWTIEGRA